MVFLRRALLWGLLLAVLVGITVATVQQEWERWQKLDLPRIAEVPAFTLVERGGREISRSDLEGAPWIAGFFFTRCQGDCTAVVERMDVFQSELPEESLARFVSVTIDPTHDTPAVLRSFARHHGAEENASRWWWLTGDQGAVLELVREGFFGTVKPEGREGGPALEPLHHQTQLVLVDAEGWIRGYYDATDDGEMVLLRRDLETLIQSIR